MPSFRYSRAECAAILDSFRYSAEKDFVTVGGHASGEKKHAGGQAIPVQKLQEEKEKKHGRHDRPGKEEIPDKMEPEKNYSAKKKDMSPAEKQLSEMTIDARSEVGGVTVDREKHGYIVWHPSNYGGKKPIDFPDAKTASDFLDGKITGLSFKAPEVLAKKIPISYDANGYKGQDEPWTERPTGHEVTDKPMVAWHYAGAPIKEFAAKETCFYRQFKKNHVKGAGYMVVIPPGTKVTYFDDEVRFDLTPDMAMHKLKGGWNPYEEKKSDQNKNNFVGHSQEIVGDEETKRIIASIGRKDK